MNRVLLTFIIFLLVSFGTQGKTFHIVGDDDFPPFSFVDENKKIVGIDIDILRELASRLEIDFDIELVPWKRLLLMTKTGAVFGSFSLFKTDKRAEYSFFTHPLHYSTYKLFTLSDNTFEFESIKDLYGKRVSIAAGFSVSDELEVAHDLGYLTLLETYSFDDSFRRLLRGGVDAFIGNELVVEYQLKRALPHNPELVRIDSLSKPIQSSRGAYFVLSKKHPEEELEYWQSKVSQTLKEIQEEGLYDSIVKRYIR